MVDHFVFAYGSLIDHHSRAYGQITILSNPVPIRVHGYRQGWLSPYGYDETTYLGVVADAQTSAIGILLHLSEESLKIIDKREKADEKPDKRVYERVEIEPSAMSLLLQGEQVERPAWLYRVVKPGQPSERCPIRQSYVDVVLRGCLSFGEDFAKEWIGSCTYWNGPWKNDRKNPKFQRRGPEIRREEEERIDAVLSDLQVLRFRRLG